LEHEGTAWLLEVSTNLVVRLLGGDPKAGDITDELRQPG
jgi:hypothetical protein